jgi:hypothetical protein
MSEIYADLLLCTDVNMLLQKGSSMKRQYIMCLRVQNCIGNRSQLL